MLVLVTSGLVGGTFARYVTSGTGTDSARVAKFGVKITAAGTTFAQSYTKDDDSASTLTNSVASTEKVIAPGTKGNMAAVTISGTPEVAVKVTYEATMNLGEEWKDSTDTYYCPLEIKVGEETLKGSDYTSADLFETAVQEKIAGFSKVYEAGTNLAEQGADVPSVSWEWKFSGNDDTKDTYLGDQAAEGIAATISLEMKTTVTQID